MSSVWKGENHRAFSCSSKASDRINTVLPQGNTFRHNLVKYKCFFTIVEEVRVNRTSTMTDKWTNAKK